MTQLKLHNTLGNIKEEFIPIDFNHVRIYACGPTVYNYAHIGNARMAVVNDLLVNVLKTLYSKDDYLVYKETRQPCQPSMPLQLS